MRENTPNIGLTYETDKNNTFKYDEDIKNNMIKVDSEIQKINQLIDSGVLQAIDLGFGINTIKYSGKAPTYPTIEFTGKHYVNLLGRDGNCEDVSKWNAWNNTLSLDNTNKVFGGNGYKATLTGTNGTVYKQLFSGYNTTKYYMFSAYLKNGNLSSMKLNMVSNGTGSTMKSSSIVTSTTNFVRVTVRLQPSDFGTGDTYLEIQTGLYGTTGQYGYIDGILWNEITEADYNNLSDAELLDKYPYVESVGCLTNPYFENRRKNLVRNGNGEEGTDWWIPNVPANLTTFNYSNGKFTLVTKSANSMEQVIRVKPNTDYYYSGNVSGLSTSKLRIIDSNGILIRDGEGAFNTGIHTYVTVRMSVYDAGTTHFDKLMLVEGTTPPTKYETCDFNAFAVNGQFFDGDYVKIQGDKVEGQLWWKHRTLYGKDYDWGIAGNYTGYKYAKLMNGIFPNPQMDNGSTWVLQDYNGYILTSGLMANGANIYYYDSQRVFYTSITNNASGWVDAVNPNDDEVKAYMNGWQTINTGQSRYTLFCAIGRMFADTTLTQYPPNTATLSVVVYTSGQTTINVADGSIFKAGDYFAVIGLTMAVSITSVNGNVLTIPNLGLNIPVNSIIVRCDNGTTDTRNVTYCKSNIAPGYEGYRLHYKLQNPESITDTNLHMDGTVWALEEGENYVTLDSGIVLSEVAKPVNDVNLFYDIAVDGYKYPTVKNSELKYKNDRIFAVYKNEVYDNLWINHKSENAFGNIFAQTEICNFDPNATYTVDYQILKTLHAQSFNRCSIKYSQDIIGSIESQSTAIESKQPKNNTIDMFIDLSVEETLHNHAQYTRGVMMMGGTNMVQINYAIGVVKKVCMPLMTFSNITFWVIDSIGNYADIPSTQVVNNSWYRDGCVFVRMYYTGSDATVKTNMLNYGVRVGFDLNMSCKGRI